MTKQGGWPPSGFGVRLRRLRDEKGLSQQALASAAGCHHFTVAKLERGEQEPAWPLVLALAKALGVSVSELEPVPGETAPPPEKRKPGRPPKKAEANEPPKKPTSRKKK